MSLYQTALTLAVSAHAGQVRKHNGTPYIVHPIMVARIVEAAGFGEVVVAAALLHDVLEDTTVSADIIATAVGSEVLHMVQALSEEKGMEWRARKAQYIENVVAAGESVWAISVADKIHNAESLLAFHGEVGNTAWSVFNKGKVDKIWFEETLLSRLQQVWQHPLLERYATLVVKMQQLEA
jgi:guanosine-3',5'-bis(diphosphate) 3'-pyrophosphohydrolase